WLRYPSGQLRSIHYRSGDTLRFTAATSGAENRATAQFRPLLQPGLYELVVAGKDKNGNTAGQFDYRISFVVATPRVDLQLRSFPNPFSVSTSFAFTIYGSSLPQEVKLQFYTAAGQLVKEVPAAALGPIRLGYNTTPFRWDGTNQFGLRLAAGVYTCRLVAATMNGTQHPYEKRAGYYLLGQAQVILLPR
ncbi:MAG: hypothetical protein FJ348_07155, partial [Sphingomonadales bacterium]|nr:hypothetical protein [Sphingomonadales bacterium]